MRAWSIAVLAVLAGCPKKQTPGPDEPKPVAADAGAEGPVATPAIDAAPAAPAIDPLCAHRPEKAGPFVLDAALAMKRTGYAAGDYFEVESSKDRPIEVCGLEGVRKWLEAAKCPDGTAGSQLGRVGSVGIGGRCNTMIERFKVGCSDGSFSIYFAVHFCGPGESM